MRFSSVEMSNVTGDDHSLIEGISNPIDSIKVLKEHIEYLKTKVKEHDTGHINTTIGVLEDRVKDLSAWAVVNY